MPHEWLDFPTGEQIRTVHALWRELDVRITFENMNPGTGKEV
jgi:hypothetical protein